MRLYSASQERLYVNASERAQLIELARQKPAHIKAFALTLIYTGCRLSEARNIRTNDLQLGQGILAIRTLKKRKAHIREIPIPEELGNALDRMVAGMKPDQPLWPNGQGEPISRLSAYRWMKGLFAEARIMGLHASPKGLRHGFGIHAISCGVPLNLIQKWMGHSDIKTTSIYIDAVGAEEREIARRMWVRPGPPRL